MQKMDPKAVGRMFGMDLDKVEQMMQMVQGILNDPSFKGMQFADDGQPYGSNVQPPSGAVMSADKAAELASRDVAGITQ